jgi:hypothetical protein
MPAIVATVQDEYPPRVLVTVSGITIGDSVTVSRKVGATRTVLRGGTVDASPDVALVVLDAELPFGVPVTYSAVVDGVEFLTSAATYDLPGGKVAVSDAITGVSAEVIIGAWPEKVRERPSTLFQAGGRNIVVSGRFTGFTGSIELLVLTESSLDSLYTLLDAATEGIVQIRRPLPVYAGIDCYVVVQRARERRFSQDGSDPKRLVILDVVQVEAWPDELEAAGYTYGDLADLYTGLTYGDLAGDYSTYLDLAQADLIP